MASFPLFLKCLLTSSVILSYRLVYLHFLWPSSQRRGPAANRTRGLRPFRTNRWKRRSRKGQRNSRTEELIKEIINVIEIISRERKLINCELQWQYSKDLFPKNLFNCFSLNWLFEFLNLISCICLRETTVFESCSLKTWKSRNFWPSCLSLLRPYLERNQINGNHRGQPQKRSSAIVLLSPFRSSSLHVCRLTDI